MRGNLKVRGKEIALETPLTQFDLLLLDFITLLQNVCHKVDSDSYSTIFLSYFTVLEIRDCIRRIVCLMSDGRLFSWLFAIGLAFSSSSS